MGDIYSKKSTQVVRLRDRLLRLHPLLRVCRREVARPHVVEVAGRLRPEELEQLLLVVQQTVYMSSVTLSVLIGSIVIWTAPDPPRTYLQCHSLHFVSLKKIQPTDRRCPSFGHEGHPYPSHDLHQVRCRVTTEFGIADWST
jgi:hypothetical protein